MVKVLSVKEMVSIEMAADAAGHSYEKMMALAGKSLAEEIMSTFGGKGFSTILALVGSGNNGGDGLVALRLMLELGWDCTAYLIADRGDDRLVSEFSESGGHVFRIDDDPGFERLRWLVLETDILVDGLLGTGIRLPLRPPIQMILEVVEEALEIAEVRPKVVAVDCPSGIDCDSGEAADVCLTADLTVCMAAVKQGLLKLPAFGYLGEMVIGEIGLSEGLAEYERISRFMLDQEYFESVIPERPMDGYKGTFGTALIVAGSKKLPGAALLAGKAAFRVGTGWVILAIPEYLQSAMIGHFPEATWLPLPADSSGLIATSAEVVVQSLSKETAILVGPGIGMGPGPQEFINKLFAESLPPLVIDADGLKLTANIQEWWRKVPSQTVVTPHPGEMSLMTGLPISEIQENRVEIAEKFANYWGLVVVLKGPFTVVAEPNGLTSILPVASPSLARAGTGDVLGGIITGLVAQGVNAFDASCAGVWLHAQAGIAAAEFCGSTAGVLAGDLINMLPGLMPN